MASVQTVTIYDQPIGVGAARLQCLATLITDPAADQVGSVTLRFVVQTKAATPGPPPVPAQVVDLDRDDWLAIRLMRGLPTP
jgi:hypothetical protein